MDLVCWGFFLGMHRYVCSVGSWCLVVWSVVGCRGLCSVVRLCEILECVWLFKVMCLAFGVWLLIASGARFGSCEFVVHGFCWNVGWLVIFVLVVRVRRCWCWLRDGVLCGAAFVGCVLVGGFFWGCGPLRQLSRWILLWVVRSVGRALFLFLCGVFLR